MLSRPRRRAYIESVVLLISLFLISSAAYALDFNVQGPYQEISVCKCGTTVNTFTITNLAQQDVALIEIINDTATVTNTVQSVPLAFGVSSTGLMPSWYRFSENVFQVGSGEQYIVEQYITIPCSARAQRYTQTVTFTASNGETTTYVQTIGAQQCSALEMTPTQGTIIANPCETGTFEITLANTQAFEETYQLSASPAALGLQLSESTVSLLPGSTRTVYLYTNPPCEVYGSHEITIKARSRQTGATYILSPLTLQIQRTYLFHVIALKEGATLENPLPQTAPLTVCQGITQQVNLAVQNLNDFTNTFSLTASKPTWVGFSNGKVTLGPQEGTTIPITVAPLPYNPDNPEDTSIETQAHIVTIKGVSEKGRAVSTATFAINVEPCFRTVPQFPSRITINRSSQELPLSFQNLGTRDALYNVTVVQAPMWVTLESTSLPAQSGELSTLILTLAPSADTPSGSYPVTVELVEYGIPYRHTINLKIPMTQTYIITILAIVGGLFIVLLLIIILLFVSRKRSEQKKKEAEELWTKTARTEQEPKAATTKSGEPPADRRKRMLPIILIILGVLIVLLVALIALFNYVRLPILSPNGTLVTNVTPIPSPTLEPLITPTPVVTPLLEPGILNITNATLTNATGTNGYPLGGSSLLIIGAVILILLFLACCFIIPFIIVRRGKTAAQKEIARPTKPVKKVALQRKVQKKSGRRTSYVWVILTGIILVVLAAVLAAIFLVPWKSLPLNQVGNITNVSQNITENITLTPTATPTPTIPPTPTPTVTPNVTETPVATEIPVNTTPPFDFTPYSCAFGLEVGSPTQFDLNDYFNDPDNDTLNFSISSSPFLVEAEITDSILELRPPAGFIGVDNITITANDQKGGNSTSGSVTICVGPELQRGYTSWLGTQIKGYMDYIIVGVLILIIIIILYSFATSSRKN